jgi:GntR family transcriptional regulator
MLVIDKISRKPIYEQIVEGVEREILKGLLREHDKLPSVRELSVLLDTNPNTIQKAFGELDRAGLIVSNPGRGCFVAPGACERIKTRLRARLQEIEDIARELKEAGIAHGELIDAIDRVFDDQSNQGKEH